MTAEIAVLNKDAVALAADSIVTVAGEKTYHTTNKLFALSEYHPVGVMIYGSAEIGGIPWETLIKLYRKRLGEKEFDSLIDYRIDFIKFLENDVKEYDRQLEEEVLIDYVEEYCEALLDNLDDLVRAEINSSGAITQQKTKRHLYSLISEHKKKWVGEPYADSCDQSLYNYVISKYSLEMGDSVRKELQEFNVSKPRVNEIISICAHIFCKKRLRLTGLVFAGFGATDVFPSYSECVIECVINQRIKRGELDYKIINSRFHDACVAPFAQVDVVHTFMRGLSPEMYSAIHDFVLGSNLEMFEDVSKKLLDCGVDPKVVRKCVPIGAKNARELGEKLHEYLESSAYEMHVEPVISAVSYLPKNELAEMAESLVSITSFKQKVSLQRESVGGLIDVAVISKSDGFVWIKRKHYFEASLNPMHMRRYAR